MLVAYSKPAAFAKSRAALSRAFRRPALAVVLGSGLAAALVPGSARAQALSPECQSLVKVMQERASLLQRWQSLQKSKQVTPAGACAIFTQLAAKVSAAIPEVEKNGVWCHLPEQVLPGLKDEQPKVDKAKATACQAVVMQKKMEAQRAQQPKAPGALGGGDSVVGGPIKMPQGAL